MFFAVIVKHDSALKLYLVQRPSWVKDDVFEMTACFELGKDKARVLLPVKKLFVKQENFFYLIDSDIMEIVAGTKTTKQMFKEYQSACMEERND